MSEQQIVNYREIIRRYVDDRIKKNPLYSMRAFAKQIGVSPSHLCRVLQGKKNLSSDSALKIAFELNFSIRKREEFLDLVSYETADEHTKQALYKKIQKKNYKSQHRTLNIELFSVISDWHHFTIFELAKTAEFKSDPKWIAKKIGLSLTDTKSAIDRLIRVGLLSKLEDDTLIPNEKAEIQTSDDISYLAIKKHHEQILFKAKSALLSPVDSREFQSLQFSLNPKDLKIAKLMIRNFVKEFEDTFKSKNGNEIFQLSLQCFALTKELNKEEM